MKRALLIAAILALAACTPLIEAPWSPQPTIEQLCNEHRYLSALKALNAHRYIVSDYEARRDAILAQAREYEDRVLRDVAALAGRREFAQALTLLQNAQTELPASLKLSQSREQLTAASEHEERRVLNELLPLKARQLQKDHALYETLQKSAITPVLKDAVARHRADVDYFAPLIARAGQDALETKEFARARQLLSIAHQLTPSPVLEEQRARAEQALSSSRKKKRVAQSAEREQRYRELSNELFESLQQRDFTAAREQLGLARELNIHTEEVENAQRLLDNIIADYVRQQVDAGNKLYTDGRIEEALASWRRADELSPTADVKEKIEKAQKFIGRLQQLQKQPAKETVSP